jgi:hypothetical protein
MKNRSLKRAIGRRERGLKKGFGGREREPERRRGGEGGRERERLFGKCVRCQCMGKGEKEQRKGRASSTGLND